MLRIVVVHNEENDFTAPRRSSLTRQADHCEQLEHEDDLRTSITIFLKVTHVFLAEAEVDVTAREVSC